MKHYSVYLLFLFFHTCSLFAQNNVIKGVVTDTSDVPIEGVAVVLQTLDSTYVDAAITDSLGVFMLDGNLDKKYMLLFQHVLYKPLQLPLTNGELGVIRLTPQEYNLDEVVVKADRKIVKVENGSLKYDIHQLMKDKAVSNAFEVMKQTPGIIGTSDDIQLLGAKSPQIVLNGQLTTLSSDQLIDLLKSMPASKVKSIEIFYNAPDQYNIKGPLINVIMEKESVHSTPLQGEGGIEYLQKHYATGKAHVSLLYSTRNFSIDFLVSGEKGRNYEGEDILARHTLLESITEIDQTGRGNERVYGGNLYINMDYRLKNKDKLSLTYTLGGNKTKESREAETSYTDFSTLKIFDKRHSCTNDKTQVALHNVRLQYDGHNGLCIGGDFTHYKSPSFLKYLEYRTDTILTDMLNNAKQKISRAALFVNQTHTLNTGWKLNYGVYGGYTFSKTNIDYLYNRGNGYELSEDLLTNNIQKEYTGNLFAEISKSFGENFSTTVSLKGEYFKADYTENGVASTLWNDWTFFPKITLMYLFSPKHILQMNINSNKTYPSYWQLTPKETPVNSYSISMGNPTLKPYRTYSGQLIYILRQKYTFLIFAQYDPDFFTQLPYQSSSELKNIFRFENIDYSLTTGIGVVLPFSVGKVINSQFTAQGIRMQQKMKKFHEISFDNSKYFGQFILNNTFTPISTYPNLKVDLNASYVTGAVQGIYDLGAFYNVSTGLKWTFAQDKGTLLLKCDNIFQSNLPKKIEINQENQYSKLRKLDDTRCLSLSFSWKFGGYKTKQHKSVDMSRFSK